MAACRRRAPALIMYLLLQNVFGQFAVHDGHTVEGVVGHSAVLPCSVTIPTNQKEDRLHILWFKNFTEKLWDCVVQRKRDPDCRPTPQSPRTHISWKFFGSADVEISALQESDSGPYQCWIILKDTYRRRDVLLRVLGLQSEGPRKDTSALRLGLGEMWSPRSVVLLAGWPLAIFLAVLFLARSLCISIRKKKSCLISIL
ncbi:uncharacterized protein LOC143785052 [Ranitomeya variabilis]|uniref:uncharacterized protein LOC143785052 n=1 Tax=Ranitomeya variabilis TaxID=490064 RepID=UPI004056C41E